MKCCHPDAGGGARAEAKAKAINEAVAVLRDPRKKALYDARLVMGQKAPGATPPASAPSETPGNRAAPERRYVRAYALPAGPRRRRRNLVGAICTAAVVIGASSFALEEEGILPRNQQWVLSPAAVAQASNPPDQSPQIMEIDVIDAVSDVNWIFTYGSAQDAVRHSNHCFNELAEYPTFRLFDRCVAFDLAAHHLIIRGGAAPGAAQASFANGALANRHSRAMGRLPDRTALRTRIAKLDRLAMSNLAQLFGSSRRAGSSYPSPGAIGTGRN